MSRLLVYILYLVGSLVVLAAEQKPKSFSNADIVKMVKADLPEATIVLAIQNGKPAFNLSPDALIALKSEGVSPGVINAMLSARAPAGRDTPEPPSESEAKRALSALAQEQSKGVVALESFTKTDGQASRTDGVDVYRMDFSALLRFSEDCIWLLANIDTILRFGVAVKPKTTKGDGWGDFLYVTQNPGVRIAKGAVYKITGYVLFERKENGWSPTQMERLTTEQSSYAAVTASKAKSNGDVLRSARYVSPDEFAKLLEATLPPPSTPLGTFESKNGKVQTLVPAGFKVEKGDGDMVGRFTSLTGTTPTDAITVTCGTVGLFNRSTTVESVFKNTVESLRTTYPGVIVTKSVDTKLAGADAKLFGALVLQNGVVCQKAITVAVCKNHTIGVLLHSTPEKFESAWPEYRRVCESYVLNVK